MRRQFKYGYEESLYKGRKRFFPVIDGRRSVDTAMNYGTVKGALDCAERVTRRLAATVKGNGHEVEVIRI